jgi:hypothetical protein
MIMVGYVLGITEKAHGTGHARDAKNTGRVHMPLAEKTLNLSNLYPNHLT